MLGTAQLHGSAPSCFPKRCTADQPCLCDVLGTGIQENNRGDVFHIAVMCS